MGKPGEEGKEKEINLGKEGGGEGGTERDAKKKNNNNNNNQVPDMTRRGGEGGSGHREGLAAAAPGTARVAGPATRSRLDSARGSVGIAGQQPGSSRSGWRGRE